LPLATLSGLTLIAQPQKTNYWKVGVTTMEFAIPGAGLLNHFNPGIEIGYLKTQKAGINYQWQLEPMISYTHHWFGHFASIGMNEYYRLFLPGGLNLSARAGVGFDLWKPSLTFENFDGSVDKLESTVVPLFSLNAAIGVDKQINKRGVMVGFQYQRKAVFEFDSPIESVPFNSMMISMKFPIKK
jgi:hypothetical protein